MNSIYGKMIEKPHDRELVFKKFLYSHNLKDLERGKVYQKGTNGMNSEKFSKNALQITKSV